MVDMEQDMRILDEPISINDLKVMAGAMFGDMVKGVVDVRLDLLSIDGWWNDQPA